MMTRNTRKKNKKRRIISESRVTRWVRRTEERKDAKLIRMVEMKEAASVLREEDKE